MSKWQTTRRRFLKGLGITAGALVVGYGYGRYITFSDPYLNIDGAIEANSFIQITPDNEIIFHLPRDEMGQGVYMGLATLIGEEMDVDPQDMIVKMADVHRDFDNPIYNFQGTGGSTSIRGHWLPTRQAGANIRALILNAAAEKLDVDINELSTDNAHVIYQSERHPYGSFADVANNMSVPDEAPLKPDADFKYIGKQAPRNDGMLKSTGTAQFGIDVELPELYRAVMVRCPVIGGTVKSYNVDTAQQMDGVIKIIDIPTGGIAVVARHYWQAKQAAALIEAEWNLPELANYSSADIEADFRKAITTETGDEIVKEGDATHLTEADNLIEATYYAPILAHATMEPMNCTVKIENGECDVWIGNQAPEVIRALTALELGISRKKVRVHSQFMGGGFGRRAYTDVLREAVQIAHATELPIQLVWSREDDMQNDYYRPASLAQFHGSVENGKIQAYHVTRVGAPVLKYTLDEALDAVTYGFMPKAAGDWLSKAAGGEHDPMSTEGLYEDYDAAYKQVNHITLNHGLRLGAWRSVGHSFSGFFKESFIDEMAYANNIDPVTFRLNNLEGNPRLKHTLEVAAQKANWGNPPAGRYQGVAVHESFMTKVTQIAEISLQDNVPHLHKVICVVDCGKVVNPGIVRSQIEGGLIFGLTAALYGEITLEEGAVQQSNFHDYQMLRIDEIPEIEVHIIESSEAPSGVGEPGTPPIPAAFANAIFAATGNRIRRLPFAFKG